MTSVQNAPDNNLDRVMCSKYLQCNKIDRVSTIKLLLPIGCDHQFRFQRKKLAVKYIF